MSGAGAWLQQSAGVKVNTVYYRNNLFFFYIRNFFFFFKFIHVLEQAQLNETGSL